MIFGFFKKKPAKSAKDGEQKAEIESELIGSITHYFSHCKAGVLKLQAPLDAGDTICIKGHTTDIKQKVGSMQVDGKPIANAKKGDEVGILVKNRVRVNDTVYKIN